MKSLVKFSDLKLTKEEMTQLNGGGSGGPVTGGPNPGSGTTTTTTPPLLPGFTIPANITVTVGAPQASLGAMAMMAGTDMNFGGTDSGAFLGSHETGHTAQQGTGAYNP
ncbi:hypothetical protein NAT51_18880 [Flavobacterium amniphilum]|uniref:hypothetical protein n=1 Tax=Flavobacterium amniphilum TaxID=1834035 RepID=UPI00202AB488|nr:hypothetical protein [Flavobacterium amniphilum]MCL9807595.1 hypothetical protein [Flavobacterium amniphilum]